jgi:hypothetical protein
MTTVAIIKNLVGLIIQHNVSMKLSMKTSLSEDQQTACEYSKLNCSFDGCYPSLLNSGSALNLRCMHCSCRVFPVVTTRCAIALFTEKIVDPAMNY